MKLINLLFSRNLFRYERDVADARLSEAIYQSDPKKFDFLSKYMNSKTKKLEDVDKLIRKEYKILSN